jgi:hypothetical protein
MFGKPKAREHKTECKEAKTRDLVAAYESPVCGMHWQLT